MTVRNLRREASSGFGPAFRCVRGVDRPLLFSLCMSLALHAAGALVFRLASRAAPAHVFILVESGEEALEMAIGSAFESAAALPKPPPEIAEKRLDDAPPPLPEDVAERERAPRAEDLFAPPDALGALALPKPEDFESETGTLTRQTRRRYHTDSREPEAVRPEALDPPAPAPPREAAVGERASAASSVGGDRSVRGVRQRARPAGSLVPRYPQGSRRRGESGTVVVRAAIDAAGRCRWARVETSSGYPELDAAAADTVRRASFQPAREDGRAVAVEERFLIEFRLR